MDAGQHDPTTSHRSIRLAWNDAVLKASWILVAPTILLQCFRCRLQSTATSRFRQALKCLRASHPGAKLLVELKEHVPPPCFPNQEANFQAQPLRQSLAKLRLWRLAMLQRVNMEYRAALRVCILHWKSRSRMAKDCPIVESVRPDTAYGVDKMCPEVS